MKRLSCTVSVAALLLAGGLWAPADEIDDVMKKIAEFSKNQKSYSGKTKTETKIDQDGYKQDETGEMIMEMVRVDDKTYKMRTESKSRSTTVTSGTTERQESASLMIMAGGYMWSYNETNGEKSATKMKLPEAMASTPVDPFATYRQYYDMKLLPDETIDGESCWVIEMKPKAGSPMGQDGGRSVTWYRKSDGASPKMITYDKNDKPNFTSTTTDIKVNGTISDDRFVFKAPPGVKVQDLSQMQQEEPDDMDEAGDEPDDEPADEPEEQPKPEKKKPEKKIKLPKFP